MTVGQFIPKIIIKQNVKNTVFASLCVEHCYNSFVYANYDTNMRLTTRAWTRPEYRADSPLQMMRQETLPYLQG